MTTYPKIQERVKQTHGFVPKPCWIADLKAENGLTRSQAPNRIHPEIREHPCPASKRAAIEAALLYFGMISKRTG
ncbi:MAG: hypothetical protein IT550_14855 [Novosphingobium sp.]|nr:hypothetical protein [Novosphingobium sp.]